MPKIATKPAPAYRQDDRLLFAMYDAERAERDTIGATDKLADMLEDNQKTVSNLTDEMEELKVKIHALAEIIGKLVTVLESIDDRQAEALAK